MQSPKSQAMMVTFILLVITCLSQAAQAVDEGALRAQVEALLREKFPDAELKPITGGFVFAHKTRTFTIYRTNKVGDWQDPMTVTGPDRGGFMVEFTIQPGRWGGAMVVPHSGTEDLYVFRESLVVRNSKDMSCHIRAEIQNPPVDGHHDLCNRLIRLFYDFDGP